MKKFWNTIPHLPHSWGGVPTENSIKKNLFPCPKDICITVIYHLYFIFLMLDVSIIDWVGEWVAQMFFNVPLELL